MGKIRKVENLKSGNMGKIRKVENWKSGKVNLFRRVENWKITNKEKRIFFWKSGKLVMWIVLFF